VIEINELYKYYGERRAVGPLSFSIEAGEIVGLLGLNGAGKTTTLRILACDLLPSSGSVRVDGIDVVDHPHEVRSRIGYLPDTPPLYGEMTVQAYLRFAAKLRGVPGDQAERRVAEVAEVTQLDRVVNDSIASLSHGYKQRVGIAQAVVHKPRLLVLDEPITGLDPVQIVEMRELLRSLRGDHTILLSSHILSEISETCDRILVIRDGEIGASGTEAELSAKLLRGVRVEVTVRAGADVLGGEVGEAASDAASSRAREVASRVEGVLGVAAVPASEPGDGIASIRIEADRDVREAVVKALIEAGLGVLGVSRSERELESVFLRLAGAPEGAEGPRAGGKGARGKKSKARAGGAAKAEKAPAEAAEARGPDEAAAGGEAKDTAAAEAAEGGDGKDGTA
jgi:ABC-2 type transport system ATP-binding protein